MLFPPSRIAFRTRHLRSQTRRRVAPIPALTLALTWGLAIIILMHARIRGRRRGLLHRRFRTSQLVSSRRRYAPRTTRRVHERRSRGGRMGCCCCCCPRSRRLRTTHTRRQPSPSRSRHIRHVRKRIRMWPGTHLNRRTARLCMGGGGECLGLRAGAGVRGGIGPGAWAGEMSEGSLRVRLGAGRR